MSFVRGLARDRRGGLAALTESFAVGYTRTMADAAMFDVDETLVGSNCQHAVGLVPGVPMFGARCICSRPAGARLPT